MYDEPTASLDTQRGKAVMDLLRQLGRERKAAVIAVTHDERMIEGFDRVSHTIGGRIENRWRLSQPAIDGEWIVRHTGGSRRRDLGGDGACSGRQAQPRRDHRRTRSKSAA